ncbi:hypothetical protein BJY00DRAFT_71400 [Aspergillus carlsbadensis]|nr:hypothetical protein BJY00DRAFT_71400 [Aspergillus carlsbadensis]
MVKPATCEKPVGTSLGVHEYNQARSALLTRQGISLFDCFGLEMFQHRAHRHLSHVHVCAAFGITRRLWEDHHFFSLCCVTFIFFFSYPHSCLAAVLLSIVCVSTSLPHFDAFYHSCFN